VRGEVALGADGPLFDLELEGQNLLLARSATAKLRADAVIALRGAPAALGVSGRVVITEGRFAQDIDLFKSLIPGGGTTAPTSGFRPVFARAGPLASATFDVEVRSEHPVELKGSLYDVALRPELDLRGTGAVPLFEGLLYVDPSTLSLPSGKLMVRSGVVRFSREAPFAPRITLSAELEAKGYDIEAQIDGPLGEPEILLSSSPPLPNDQLLLLFLTGQLPTASNQGLAAARTVGAYLAQDTLVRWLGGGTLEEESVLANLAFEIGADVSQTGAATWVGRYYFDSRRARTGRTTYLLAEMDVWDKTNFGFGLRYRFP
jgi:translocation and assembly module TamB